MKLSILIPTYNRSLFLKKNLDLLNSHVHQGNFITEIEIVISNNNSSDNTDEILLEFQKQHNDIQLRYYLQKGNIGLEKNALFVLKEAKAEYVMYLGDDDYIDFEYLDGVLKHLKNSKNIFSIIPSWVAVDIQGNRIHGNRDTHLPNKLYAGGFNTCLENSWRGHQLSGLVFKRDKLYNSYIENNVNNIYPFIFFTAISCLQGDTLHFTQYPIKITCPGQQNKDWGYGKDGLINEIFDNYKKLPLRKIDKTKLELKIIRTQQTRVWSYKKISNSAFLSAFLNIWLSKNSTFIFKIIFPFEILRQYLYRVLIK